MKIPGHHMTVVEKLKVERAFTAFVTQIEPRLRIALMAAYGTDRGRDAAAEALAYAWGTLGSDQHHGTPRRIPLSSRSEQEPEVPVRSVAAADRTSQSEW